ncbi:MAG TPA: ABC transporter permease [Tissierellaceae bacterium]
MEVFTILWKEILFFKRRMFNIVTAAMINPLLYMIAFGWGLGSDVQVEGYTYMHFVIPGIIAMTTMNTSFSAMSVRLNSTRLHERSFEFYLTSPVNMKLLALGFILSGALRGMIAASLVILVSTLFGVYINITSGFIIICFLNSFLFAALGYGAAMTINSHYDINRFSTFIMTPMSFLSGTFFSLEKLPIWMKRLIEILPLTHATNALRSITLEGSYEKTSILVLLVYSVILYIYSIYITNREIF